MKITYDVTLDVLRIILSAAPIDESDEDKPGMILDYDAEGNVVGIEVLAASTRVDDPRSVKFSVAG